MRAPFAPPRLSEPRNVAADAQAVEALDHPIALLENTTPNPKLTTPGDLAYLEFLLARASDAAPASA